MVWNLTPDVDIGRSSPRSVMRTRSLRFAVPIAILSLLAAACGAGASPTPAGSATPGGPTAPPTAPAAPVEIRWYCCLGAGDAPEQVEVEQKVVEAFNASHPNIKLIFEAVPYAGARDALATQIGSGAGPDIVGPVGIGGAEAFHGQWLDLGPLIEKASYDLDQYSQGAVDFYKIGGEGQVGIPFAIYPSALFYKAGLFEEAGLAEPPHKYGEKYRWPDGREVEWDYDTIRELALKLTVDKNGKDATQAGFDPKSIVQYGFEPQRDDVRGLAAYFGAGTLAASDGTTVAIPPAWSAAWKWFYDATWTDHFVMTGPVYESTEFNGGGYSFFSGRVAMAENFLWSTYGVADAGDDWNLAAIPSFQGQTTAAFNADTFRILEDTKHPDEAFEALTYLLGEGSGDLLQIYGGMPARSADQDAFFQTLGEGFPQTIDWQVAIDGVQYADNPNFESYMPKYNESLDLLGTYLTKWTSTAGLDMDKEIAALESELQAIWSK